MWDVHILITYCVLQVHTDAPPPKKKIKHCQVGVTKAIAKMKGQELQADWMNFLKREFRWSFRGVWATSSADMILSEFKPFLTLPHILSQPLSVTQLNRRKV